MNYINAIKSDNSLQFAQVNTEGYLRKARFEYQNGVNLNNYPSQPPNDANDVSREDFSAKVRQMTAVNLMRAKLMDYTHLVQNSRQNIHNNVVLKSVDDQLNFADLRNLPYRNSMNSYDTNNPYLVQNGGITTLQTYLHDQIEQEAEEYYDPTIVLDPE